MKRRLLTLLLIVSMLTPVLVGPAALAADKSAAELLPATTVVYIEMPKPGKVVDYLANHPLRKRLEAIDEIRQAYDNNPGLNNVRGMIQRVEQEVGMPFDKIVASAAGAGLAIGFDPASKGVAILIKATDEQTQGKLRDALLSIARKEAENNGQPDPIKMTDYHGITAYAGGPVRMATFAKWTVLTNQDDLGRAVLDNHLANAPAPGSTLAGEADFAGARGLVAKDPAVWAYIRVRTLRDMGMAKELFAPGNNNPGAELLLGGIVGALRGAPYATLELHLNDGGATLAVALPTDAGKRSALAKFVFPEPGKGAAAKPLKPAGTIMSVSLYRDIGAMWLAAPDILDENAAAGLARADTALSGFFAGRNFGTDVMATIKPQIQLVVAQQNFKPGDQPVPAIRLPAAALLFQSTKAQELRPFIKIAFQNAVGLAGIAATQQGLPPIDVNSIQRGKAMIVSANFLAMENQKGKTDADIRYNLSPTLAMVGNRFMLCSSRSLAEQLVDLAEKQGDEQRIASNTLIELSTAPGLKALRDNRDQLVTQNMLRQGNSKEQAEKQVDILLSVLDYLRDVSLSVGGDDKAMRIELSVSTASAE